MIENGEFTVNIPRESACGGDCAGCPGCPVNDGAIVKVKCDIPAKVGDRVSVDFSDSAALRSSFLLYGAPLIAFFIGYGVASMWIADELPRILVGVAGVVGAIIFSRIVDRHGKNNDAKIVEIIGKDDGCSDM